MKTARRVYRGIEYVRIDELPPDQRRLLMLSPLVPERIKILVDGKVFDQCLLYNSYTEWFNRVYQATQVSSLESNGQQKAPIEVNKN
jgi:hypothetical protein